MRKDRSKALSVKGRMVVTAALAAVIFASCPLAASAAPSAPSASVGAKIRRVVPSTIRNIALTNQADQSVDLASWPGKTVLLVPFLTLCSDICPMTTANILDVERSLRSDKASSDVEIVELSVDPGRDTRLGSLRMPKSPGRTGSW